MELAVLTTPLSPPPTITGLSRREGSLFSSPAAKKASKSRWATTPDTVIAWSMQERLYEHMFVYKTRPPTRFLTPDLAILDPELTRSMPPSLTAATAMDALSHAVEALTGSQSSPYSDALALQAVGLIVGNVQVAADDGENMSARGALMVAANLAGLAFNHSMVGCGHGMAHALGGLYGIPAHGPYRDRTPPWSG